MEKLANMKTAVAKRASKIGHKDPSLLMTGRITCFPLKQFLKKTIIPL